VLDTELFEAPQVHVYNSALRQFWRFEASAAAAARSAYESILFNQLVDGNFEEIARPITFPCRRPPKRIRRPQGRRGPHHAHAGGASRDPQPRGNGLSLSAATDATFIHGRQDWVAWQESSATVYASRIAGTVGRVIAAQKAATAALMRLRRPFGVGSVDLKLAHRTVARDGFVPGLVTMMQRFDLTHDEIGVLVKEV